MQKKGLLFMADFSKHLALLPYQETLRSLQIFNPTCDQLCNLSKSKPFYVMLRNKIRNIEDCRTKFLPPY